MTTDSDINAWHSGLSAAEAMERLRVVIGRAVALVLQEAPTSDVEEVCDRALCESVRTLVSDLQWIDKMRMNRAIAHNKAVDHIRHLMTQPPRAAVDCEQVAGASTQVLIPDREAILGALRAVARDARESELVERYFGRPENKSVRKIGESLWPRRPNTACERMAAIVARARDLLRSRGFDC